MANYALGYPVVTGCHTAHRMVALAAMGGLAAHDADDLLITLRYRAAGWRGVYVPEILARGLTPVDWPGYLAQQRRWARSVLDVKLRAYPGLAPHLPWRERLLSLLHGMYYLRSAVTPVGLGILIWLLLTGGVPEITSWGVLGYAAPVVGALTLADVYRQRFYLGGRDEWGLHWPAAVLGFAKWPYMLLALCEVLIGYRGPSILTRKIGRASRHSLLLLTTHGLTAVAVAATSVLGTLAQHVSLSTAHLSSALVLASALGVIASERLPYPEPYDPRLPKDWA